ncbi:MAG: hypothetical protein RL701_6781 [Pseudomonadota bacterium]
MKSAHILRVPYWLAVAWLCLGPFACSPGCPSGSVLRRDLCIPTHLLDAGQDASASTAAPGIEAGNDSSRGDGNASSGNTGSLLIDAGTGTAGTGRAGTGSRDLGGSGSGGTSVVSTDSGTTGAAGAQISGGSTAMVPPGAGCTPQPEVCDNVDNDCDTQIDENVTMPCGSSSNLPCKLGTYACHAGKWDDPKTQCVGAVEPKDEVCDAERVDENCDGTPNDRCACAIGETQPCNTNTPCAGIARCVDNKFSTACESAVTATAERCDGVDNDCDMRIDEDGTLCGSTRQCSKTPAGCFDCLVDGDCTNRNSACTQGYCELSNHTCQPRAKGGKETTCTTGRGNAGFCSDGACVSCVAPSDCGLADDCHSYECSAHECVTKIKTGAKCGSGSLMACDALGLCKNSCGNGTLDSAAGEACDSEADLTCNKCARTKNHWEKCVTLSQSVTDPGDCPTDAYCASLYSHTICRPHCSRVGEGCETHRSAAGICLIGNGCAIVCGQCNSPTSRDEEMICTINSSVVCPPDLTCTYQNGYGQKMMCL